MLDLTLTLYHTRFCPFCIMVVRVINDLKLDIELRDTASNPAFHSELVAGGGKQQVPCLKIQSTSGDAQWMYESRDIIEYLKQYKASIV